MTNDSQDQPEVTIGGQGATLKTVYAKREMKVFAITEPELNTVSILNALSLLSFSVASFLLSLSIDVKIDIPQTEEPQSAGFILFFWGTAVGAAVCYVLGGIFLWLRRQTIVTIKKQSSSEQAD